MQRRPGTLPHGEKHADRIRPSGVEGVIETGQCPVVGVAGVGGVSLQQAQLHGRRVQGDLVGANHGMGSSKQVLKVDRERLRSLLGDARGAGMLTGGSDTLFSPDFVIQYIGKA